ncbi:MAG: 4-hydroxy-3-methylbut-2-enyl diphosphate reductase [Candidatus Moranbacteria bacterium]|nr:4-hydroxy-3-methylbut-2-enyl diphosphate reductase [Candidatus Moranbacteria bacterium]
MKSKKAKNKPEIKVAKSAGFCFGVRRAVEIANQALSDPRYKKVYCWGDLIHNPWVVKNLKQRGLRVVDVLEEIQEGGVFVIRSHGMPQDMLDKISSKNVKIIDAACPYVKKAQEAAKRMREEGYHVLIFGNPEHVEVKGINSAIDYKGSIISPEYKRKDLKRFEGEKVALLSQTTQNKDNFEKLRKELEAIASRVKTEDTICGETSKKQKEVKKLAQECDLLIVVGGKNSSNTGKLAKTGTEMGTKTLHIESSEELEREMLEGGVKKIAITGGASTPDELIAGVENKLKQMIRNS